MWEIPSAEAAGLLEEVAEPSAVLNGSVGVGFVVGFEVVVAAEIDERCFGVPPEFRCESIVDADEAVKVSDV